MSRQTLTIHFRETAKLAQSWRKIIGTLAALAMWVGASGRIDDWAFFVAVARDPSPLNIYNAHPHFQSGPLTLPLMDVANVLGRPIANVLSLVTLLLLQWSVERWLGRPAPLTGHLVLGIAWGAAVAAGHLDDMATSICLLTCAVHYGRRDKWRAGLWLGLACGFKPWAVIGAAMVMTLPAATTALVVAGTCWLPFILLGAPFAAAADGAKVQPQSLLSLVITPGDPYPLWWRPLELAALLIVSIALSTKVGPLVATAWASFARLLLEPALWQYYYIAPALFSIIAGLQTRWLFATIFFPLLPGAPGLGGRILTFVLAGRRDEPLRGRGSRPLANNSSP